MRHAERVHMIDLAELAQSTDSIRRLFEAALYKDARGLARRIAAELPEPTLKEGAPEVRARAELARTLALVGEGRWARIQLERAIATAERALGAKHPELGTLLLTKAQVLAQLVYYPEIEPVCKRALAIREEALGPDHPETAHALLAWAELVIRHWHAYLARPLARRARAVLEPLSGSLDPTVLRARELLALAGRGTTPDHKLSSDLRDLIALRERVQGAAHVDLARVLEPLIELEPGFEDALAAHDRARTLLAAALGDAHPRVAHADALMAERCLRAADTARGYPLIDSALSKLETAWADDHPDRMPVYGRLTMLLVWAERGPVTDGFRARLSALKDLERK